MSSKRKNIRTAVVNLLKAAGTAAGQNVFPNRARSNWAEDLPVILVYSLHEAVQVIEVSQPLLQRTLTVAIDARAKADNGVDDALDDMAESIETAINADPTFGNLAIQSTLTTTEIDFNGQGETPFGGARLIYEVIYITP